MVKILPERLYIYPVLYDIYILDGKGADPVPAMLSKPRQGHLIIRKRFPTRSDTALNALLVDPARPEEPLMELHYVRLVGMTRESMVIEGTIGHSFRKGHKAKIEYAQQRWLCKAPGTKVVIDADLLRRSKTNLTNAMAADPFHPLWDDVAGDATYGPVDPSIN